MKEDIFIRDFLRKNFSGAIIAGIEIKRKLNFIEINISCSKPSIVLDVSGNFLFLLREDLVKTIKKNFSVTRDIAINIVEVVNPDSNSRILAEFISQQLERRVPFRKVMKTSISKAQKSGVKGVKIQISGRLNGAEIARTEWIREGQVPLHTLKANIDYCSHKAHVYFNVTFIKNLILKTFIFEIL